MGTASTMACLAEVLGVILPGSATIPAVHADRLRAAERTGLEAVPVSLRPGTTLKDVITVESIENAIRMLLAIGGSTNAVIHLAAIAGRVGIRFPLSRLNELSATTPVIVNLKPAGTHYMEDLQVAGGVGAVLRELAPLLHLGCRGVTGTTLNERLSQPDHYVDRDVIRTITEPFDREGGLVALFGSLCPGGAIPKRAAADSRLFEHQGRAVVFDGLDDLSRRIDDPNLDVNRDDILVLKNAGPVAAGMPEAGYLPIPGKLARAGSKGYGPDLGRPDERHCIRHDHPARYAGGKRRRSLGHGRKWRSDMLERAEQKPRSAGRRCADVPPTRPAKAAVSAATRLGWIVRPLRAAG